MISIRQLVADPEWQALRRSLVGTWKTGASANVRRLTEYLGDFTDPDRLRRVHNYLTGSGFRLGIIGTDQATQSLLTRVRKARGK